METSEKPSCKSIDQLVLKLQRSTFWNTETWHILDCEALYWRIRIKSIRWVNLNTHLLDWNIWIHYNNNCLFKFYFPTLSKWQCCLVNPICPHSFWWDLKGYSVQEYLCRCTFGFSPGSNQPSSFRFTNEHECSIFSLYFCDLSTAVLRRKNRLLQDEWMCVGLYRVFNPGIKMSTGFNYQLLL